MAFERFVRAGRSYAPKVSIWTRGQIGFNRGAVKKMSMRDYKYAILFYDKENKRVGIKLTNNPSEEGATKISFGSTGAFISARAFLDYYDIPRGETKRYDIYYDDENDMWVFDL